MPGAAWPFPSAFPAPHASPGFRFWRDFMAWQRGLNHVLKPLGLTQPQFALLANVAWLTRDGDSLSQQQLAEVLELDRMHVSQVVSRLDAGGLVTRRRSTDDRRRNGLVLTARGARTLRAALPVVEGYDRQFFGAG